MSIFVSCVSIRFRRFLQFSQSPETGNQETGKLTHPANRLYLNSANYVYAPKYILIPTNKLVGVMVNVMVDEKTVICVQRGMIFKVLRDA